MKYVVLLVLVTFIGGCGVKDQGTRTLNFGMDGVTVTSETFTMSPEQLVDVEKEKTRQICFKQKKDADKELVEAVKDSPFALAMWEQTKALNNAMHLVATGKPYDPCPGSTNSADVEIADAKMYESIYSSGFSVLKTGAYLWGGAEIFDSVFGAVAAGGYSINLNGDGNNFNATDSFKESYVGNNSSAGNIFGTTHEIPPEEETEVDEVDDDDDEIEP